MSQQPLVRTLPGFNRLNQRRQDLQQQIQRFRTEAESVADGGNSLNEGQAIQMAEINRQRSLAESQLTAVEHELAVATIAPTPTQTTTVQVGHMIVLEIENEKGRRKETLIVGGPGETDDGIADDGEKRRIRTLSCMAPLTQKFIGKKVGHEAEVVIDRKTVCAELLEISLPPKEKKRKDAPLSASATS